MKARILLAGVAGLSLALVASLGTAEEKKEFNCKCVVSGGPAKETSVVEYKGKKVYFCCNNCPKKFEADPEAFTVKVRAQWAVTGQLVQVACPFSGRPLNADTAIDVGGASVAFCCNNCKGRAEKAEDVLALIFGDIAKGFTLQTVCPLSNKPINVDISVEHDGKKVYFCCPGCPDGFKADPEKFLSKLPQFAEEG